MKNIITFILSLCLGLGILYIVYAQQQATFAANCDVGVDPYQCSLLKKIFDDVKNANWIYIVFGLSIGLFSNVLRALRWQQLTEPMGVKIGFANALCAILVGYFTNLALPRVGEVLRGGIIAKYEDISVEKAFGTIVTERIVDVLIFGIVIIVSLMISFDDIAGYLSQKGDFSKLGAMNILVPVLVLVMAAAYFAYKLRAKFISSTILNKIEKIVKGFLEGIASVKDVKNKPLFLAYSIGIWLCYLSITIVMSKAFPPTENLSFEVALSVLLFGSLGMFIPSPGGMGSYQFLVAESLSIYGVSPSNAFSFANLVFFSINIFGTILFGLIAYILLPIINIKKPLKANDSI